jgi:hypothetical protein
MAGTTFSQIFDMFMMTVKDSRLVDLYNQSTTNFETYLTPWLNSSIAEFYNCDQSLANSSSTFTETLTQKNIDMLVSLMKKHWFEREIDDVNQMKLHLQNNKEFKSYSEAQNLDAKLRRYREMKEEISQNLVNYSLANDEMWTDWVVSGIYWTP